MIRKAFLLLVSASLLAACSSGGGTSPVVGAIKGVILPTLGLGDEEETSAPTATDAPTTLTREMIVQSGLAFIRANIDGDPVTNVLTGTSLNGAYVTYVSGFKQSISVKGTLVTATRGLGSDLLSVADSPNDPIANMTPIANWPTESYDRSYRFSGTGPGGTLVTVSCRLTRQAPMQITIVEVTYDVVAFIEACSGDGVSFNNIHLADKDGQIWQTRQWVGEGLGILNIEVLEPVTL